MKLKNLFIKLFVASMVLGVNPANAQKEANRLYFPSKDIKEIRMKPVSPEVFVGIPRDLYIVEGNLLILDSYEGKHLTLVDLQGPFKERRIGSQGQGPNEFLRISELSYNSEMKLLRVFDEYARRQSSYSVAGRNVVFNDANLKGKVLLPNTTYQVISLGDSFVANGNFDGKQFALLDGQSQIVETFGVFPGSKDAVNAGLSFYLLTQNRMVANPRETHFAAAGFMHDQLVFYKKEGKSVKKLREYFNFDVTATPSVSNQNGGQLYYFSENESTMRAYIDLYATDAHLYVLYLGLSKADLEKKGHPCYILKFDWESNFVGGYKSDTLLQCFAVDEVNRKIYAVTSVYGGDESMLVECGLP